MDARAGDEGPARAGKGTRGAAMLWVILAAYLAGFLVTGRLAYIKIDERNEYARIRRAARQRMSIDERLSSGDYGGLMVWGPFASMWTAIGMSVIWPVTLAALALWMRETPRQKQERIAENIDAAKSLIEQWDKKYGPEGKR